jgi:hypothetical protein
LPSRLLPGHLQSVLIRPGEHIIVEWQVQHQCASSRRRRDKCHELKILFGAG